MFATWCYWQARVADPNGVDYQTAYPDALTANGKAPTKPLPGDLVIYDRDQAPTGILVGPGKVVQWVNGHPKKTSL